MIFLAVSLSVGAQNYFTAGTKWISEIHGTGDGKNEHIETTWLEAETEFSGMKCIPMYIMLDDDATTTRLATYIRVDGEKVYFLPDNVSGTWALLYDFGLKENERCIVRNIPYPWNDKSAASSYPNEMVYVGPTEEQGLPSMKMDVIHNNEILGSGVWIKGIGSVMGVTENEGFGKAGGGGKLLEVISNGKTVYKTESGIAKTEKPGASVVVADRTVSASGLEEGQIVSLYAIDGSLVSETKVKSGMATIKAPAPGIYILRGCGATMKISMK
ncbi:MAG: hypothetical protein NC039_03095 [Muribaculaceae bacterium]|nr:hypothetical protein [Muribaculaceae bacterium]